MKNGTPNMPEKRSDQIEMIWKACFNELPHKIDKINLKVNLMLTFGALSLGLLGVVIALVN